MSHPDSPGSPTHPEKVIRVFSCVVCTRILILSACRSWRLLFLFLLLTMIFVQGESHYQSSLEREVAAIEQTAGCLPPRVTPIIHQFKSNRRQLDFWGYYPGRCQQKTVKRKHCRKNCYKWFFYPYIDTYKGFFLLLLKHFGSSPKFADDLQGTIKIFNKKTMGEDGFKFTIHLQ